MVLPQHFLNLRWSHPHRQRSVGRVRKPELIGPGIRKKVHTAPELPALFEQGRVARPRAQDFRVSVRE